MESTDLPAEEVIRLETTWSAYAPPTMPMVLADAEGASLWDLEGHCALDFWCGDAGIILGHRHPALLKALEEQTRHLTLAPLQCFHTLQGTYCQHLAMLTGFDLVETFPSAAQALQEVVEIAHSWGEVQKHIPFSEGHILFSHNASMTEIQSRVDTSTVAIIVHLLSPTLPLQLPEEAFFDNLRDLCIRNNLLLIVDESLTSLGRSGSWLMCHQYDAKPDIVCLGEEIGGGIISQSAILLRKGVFDKVSKHRPTSAFARSPLAATVGLAVLETIEIKSLALRAETIGKVFRAEMQDLVPSCIANVEGIGTINSIQLLPDHSPAEFCNILAQRGLLAQPIQPNSVRFSPPLTLTDQELTNAIGIIRAALDAPR